MQFLLAGVDFIELGFRSIKNNEYFGPLAYTTDNFIFDLNIPDNIQIGIMINASEFKNSKFLESNLVKIFQLKQANHNYP